MTKMIMREQIRFDLFLSGEEGEDDIEATVKSLIDAGTCDGVRILKF